MSAGDCRGWDYGSEATRKSIITNCFMAHANWLHRVIGNYVSYHIISLPIIYAQNQFVEFMYSVCIIYTTYYTLIFQLSQLSILICYIEVRHNILIFT